MENWQPKMNNGIGKKLNIDKIESNLVSIIIPKLEEFGEFPRRNTLLMKPRYVSVRITTNFPLDSYQGKRHPLKKLTLPQLAKGITP